jgi:hypothetical protein
LDYLVSHRAHDFGGMAKRWRALARRDGMTVRPFAEEAGYPIVALEPARPRPGEPFQYVSAGVHGDEPAAVVALLEWAEASGALLGRKNFLLVPCFNPWGLVNNARYDSRGRDLNRRFDAGRDPRIKGWTQIVSRCELDLALCLHEDYDAQGMYLYELARGPGSSFVGHRLLAAARRLIPPDPRPRIEGRRASGGLIKRPRVPRHFTGLPEAIVLHRLGARRTLTIESPSEFSLLHRVKAIRAMLDAAFR